MAIPALRDGLRVLVVEDDYFIADEVAGNLARSGARILGPVGSIEDAMKVLGGPETPEAAVLDINLRGEMAYVVADRLLALGIPFVFATGYDVEVIPARYASIGRCPKPVSYGDLARALARGHQAAASARSTEMVQRAPPSAIAKDVVAPNS